MLDRLSTIGSKGVLIDILIPIINVLATQVLQTLRSNIQGRSMEDSVGVYLPTARGYMDVDEQSLKRAVREVGTHHPYSCRRLQRPHQ